MMGNKKHSAENPQPNPQNDLYQYQHVHDYTGITTCNDGHCHIHPGVTSIPIPYGTSHIHQIVGATTYMDGHYHIYNAYTGPAADLANGFHTHYNAFSTSFVDGHIHNVQGYVMATKSEEHKQPATSPNKP